MVELLIEVLFYVRRLFVSFSTVLGEGEPDAQRPNTKAESLSLGVTWRSLRIS